MNAGVQFPSCASTAVSIVAFLLKEVTRRLRQAWGSLASWVWQAAGQGVVVLRASRQGAYEKSHLVTALHSAVLQRRQRIIFKIYKVFVE